MIKHLEDCILDAPIGPFAAEMTARITEVLNRPIGEDLLNIVNTTPEKDAQIYGWKSPIKEHSDDTGYFFFMPIHMDGKDELVMNGQSVELKLNNLYLVDDRIPHSTTGTGNTVALFSGSYTEEELNQALFDHVFSQMKEIAARN